MGLRKRSDSSQAVLPLWQTVLPLWIRNPHRTYPRGHIAVLPLAVPLEVPQWAPNLTGSQAVPKRYQSGTTVTPLRYLSGTSGVTTALKWYYLSRYRKGIVTCSVGQNQRRTPERYPGAVLVGVAVLPLLVPVVPVWQKLVFSPFSLQPCHLAIRTQN